MWAPRLVTHGIDGIQVISTIKINHIKPVVGACAIGWLLGCCGLGEVFVTILIVPVGNLAIGITRHRSFIGGIEPEGRSIETIHRIGSISSLAAFRINIGTNGERAPSCDLDCTRTSTAMGGFTTTTTGTCKQGIHINITIGLS